MVLPPLRTGLMIGVALLATGAAGAVRADSVRFRFMPGDPSGAMTQVPAGPDGALGDLRTGFRGTPKPFAASYQANRLVTFRHPYTSRNVIVPLKLPDSTPRVEHIGDRIRLNYGTYYVEARFLTDGGVDVVYNSGLLRSLPP
jgi:hypothetical protein